MSLLPRFSACLLGTLAWGLMTVVSLSMAGEPVAGPPDPGLTFHASFDKRDVRADYARGRPESTTFTESLELRGVEGISGPGLKLDEGERLDYEMKGNFDVRQGSVSLWVQPVNWYGNDRRFHHHFVAQCPGVFSFYLYQYTQPTHLFFYIAVGKRQVRARTPTDRWQPGHWYKIDATWDQQTMRLYVNSDLQGEVLLPDDFKLPDRNDGFISITPVQFWKNKFSSPDDRTIVDEVKIYNRVRTPDEIRRDYVALADEQTAAKAEPVDLLLDIDSAAGVARVRLDAFRLSRTAGKALTAQVQLKQDGGPTRVERKGELVDDRGVFELPIDDLAPGKYTVCATVATTDGKHRETVETSFERPDAPWLAPMPQYDHVVPEPWTPVAVSQHETRVWGRGYRFGNGPLPETITTQSHSILHQPAQLLVDTGDGLRSPQWGQSEVGERFPDKVTRQGKGTAGGLTVEFTTAVEFDGMLRCDLTLKPTAVKARLDAFALTIPLVREHANYLLTNKLVPWAGESLQLDFRECLWLTGHHVGLCWFAESDANWVSSDGVKPIRIERDNTVTTLTINLVASPVEIDGAVTYTFGIQATPVRPLPENWRTFHLGGYGKIRGANAQITASGGGCLKQSAWLEPWRDDIMRRVCKKWRDLGSPSFPYSTPTYLSDHNPTFDFYHTEWHNTSGHEYVGYKHREGFEYSMVAMCPGSDFAKLMAYWVENLSRDYDIGGLYFDCCYPDKCANPRHGCGGTDAFGKRFYTYPIFALREILKRTFTILHSRDKLLINHAHSRFLPPCHAFSDYWFPGEQYAAKLGNDIWYYCNEVPADVWQVELSPRPKGVGVSFLPQYGRGTAKKYRDDKTLPSRSLLACLLVHDIPSSASWINLGELQKVWDLQATFGLSKARFLPYWEPNPVQADEPLLASAYQLPNAIVIVVSKLQPKQVEGSLRIDGKKLSVGRGWTLTNKVTGKRLDAPLDNVPITLPGRDYTILSLEW